MRARQNRVAAVRVAAAAILMGGCAGVGPTTPGDVGSANVEPAWQEFSSGFSVEGRVTSTLRRLDVGEPLGQVVQVESGTYSGSMDAAGRPAGRVVFPSGTTAFAVLAGDRPDRQSAKWRRTIHTTLGRGDVAVYASGSGGAPVSEYQIVRQGVLVSRTAKAWKRLRGGWRVSQIVTTSFRAGRPVASVTLDFDDSVARTATGATASLMTAPTTRSFASEESGVCNTEMGAVEQSFDIYETATLGLLTCLKGPWACFGAGVAYTLALRELLQAFDAADACLDRY